MPQHRAVPGPSAAHAMAARPELLAGDFESYIPGDRRRALAAGVAMPDRVSGSAIFADISGFTPLTEALATDLGPQRGAEELTAVLSVVFDAVLGELHRYGGSVIYFSGDAVTCWLDGDNGIVGLACALAMQRAMSRVGTITTPGGRTVQLGMKVAVCAGHARRFLVGDPGIQLIDVLAGALMDRLADAEHHAERGEVVADMTTLAALRGRVDIALVRGHHVDEVGVVAALAGEPPALPPPQPYPKLPRSVSRRWLLPAVYERMRAGRGEFLSELRPAIPMFVRFGGIDFDNDPEAQARLDQFIRLAQRVIDNYGGNVLQLTIGDKGAYLFAIFGAPLAHEDDAARACAAALDVLALKGETAATGLQVGLSHGRLRSGAYGHRHRRTFSCLGDAVNLSARLMSAAPGGQAYVTADVAKRAGESFVFEELADLRVKGKAAPVAARRLIGRATSALRRQRRPTHPLIGRDAELGSLLDLAGRSKAGAGQVVAIVAEPGMGKSRLVDEVVQALDAGGTPTYRGEAASVGSATSYLAWQPIWRAMFGAGGDGNPVPELEKALSAVDEALVARLPLLGAVIGTDIEDNTLTRSFDAKLRKASLESLLARYLVARCEQGPLVLALEDCHWLDALSSDLLEVLARASATLPVLMLLTYRPGSFAAPKLKHTTVIELDRLAPESCKQLVAARFSELYGSGAPVADALLQRLVDRAEGNAFYLEELVNYLHAEGADISNDVAAASVELPVSLSTLVLSRIDTLVDRPRRALKVASVVGREFGVDMLTGAYPDLGAKRQVTGHLRRLCAENLVVQESPASDAYAFKHAVIREVAYDSLPFAMRAVLHGRIGSWLELTDPHSLDLLAHHFWHSTDEEKKRQYLLRAGEAAQARYANDAAVEYFRRAVPLLGEAERGPEMLKLGAVLELSGHWAEAEAVFGEALQLAERLGDEASAARALAARADPVRKQGRFDDAVVDLEKAARTFGALGEVTGLGRVAHLRGTIAAQRGDYAEARAQYERSLAIRVVTGERAAEASLLSNLAIVAEYEEDYDRAQELNEQALELRTRLGDRWGMGVSLNNLGVVANLRHDHAASRRYLERSLQLEVEVGDLWMVAMARHNLANTNRELRDLPAACQGYSEALDSFSLIGDKWVQPILLEDLAMLVADGDPAAAVRLVGAADAMREATGSPRVAAVQAQLDDRLGGARLVLGEQAEAEHLAGTKLGDDAALLFAQQLCKAGAEGED